MDKLAQGVSVTTQEQIGLDLYLSHFLGGRYADQHRAYKPMRSV